MSKKTAKPAAPKDPPYGSPAYWRIKDAEADARKYHDSEHQKSEPYGRKANPCRPAKRNPPGWQNSTERAHNALFTSVCGKVDSWVRCGLPVDDAIQRVFAASVAGPAVKAAVLAHYRAVLLCAGKRRNPVIRQTGSYADQDRQERAILARLQAIHDRIAATGFRTHAAALATFLDHAKGYSFGLARLRKAEVKWRENAKELESDAARFGKITNPYPGIVYLTPGAGAASRVRAGNDGRFYVEDDPGGPMTVGWAFAEDHRTLAEAIDAANRRAAAMRRGWKRNPAKPKAKKPVRRTAKKRRRGFQVQSFLLDKDHFSLAMARAWLHKYGHKYGDIRDGERDWHAVQADAGDYQRARKGGYGGFRTIQLAKHVQAVIGIPAAGSDAIDAKRGKVQQSLRLPHRKHDESFADQF